MTRLISIAFAAVLAAFATRMFTTRFALPFSWTPMKKPLTRPFSTVRPVCTLSTPSPAPPPLIVWPFRFKVT